MKSRKVRNTAQSTKMADGIYPKLYIFNTPVQKEGNLPGFHIHTVCNLPFGHSSELKAISRPPQLTIFFTWPPLIAVIFLDDTPPPPPPLTKKKINPPLRFYLTFSITPLLDAIVLTMKTKFTIPILQTALRLKKKKTQIKRNRSQTLLFLGPS